MEKVERGSAEIVYSDLVHQMGIQCYSRTVEAEVFVDDI